MPQQHARTHNENSNPPAMLGRMEQAEVSGAVCINLNLMIIFRRELKLSEVDAGIESGMSADADK